MSDSKLDGFKVIFKKKYIFFCSKYKKNIYILYFHTLNIFHLPLLKEIILSLHSNIKIFILLLI